MVFHVADDNHPLVGVGDDDIFLLLQVVESLRLFFVEVSSKVYSYNIASISSILSLICLHGTNV